MSFEMDTVSRGIEGFCIFLLFSLKTFSCPSVFEIIFIKPLLLVQTLVDTINGCDSELKGYRPTTPKPQLNEDKLKSALIQIERKTFVFTLKENLRGRLLRITEDLGGRHNAIIVPSTGLVEFKKLLEEMIKASEELPPEKKSLD